MFGRQPHLPVDVALGLAAHTITEPNTSKFIQKLRECIKWAQEKAEAFQAKEAQRYKWNYDKRIRDVALEVGEMVLVHDTTFKGCHKMQDRWENRDMWWKSSPNLIYQVMWYAPGMGKGAARPYIGTICYPSTLTWGRTKLMNLKRELKITPQLQCHLQTFCKTVQINLFLLDAALKPPGTNFPGGIKILGCQQAPGQPASGMHGLTCVSVCLF